MTRRAAADRAPTPPAAPRRLAAKRGGRSPCELISELLVARMEDRLTPADRDRLARHIDRCEACRATAQRFRSAELAYRDPPEQALPEQVAGEIMRALVEAVPVASSNGSAPASNGALSEAPVEEVQQPPAAPEEEYVDDYHLHAPEEPDDPDDSERQTVIVHPGAYDAERRAEVAAEPVAEPPASETTGLLGPLTSGGRELPRRHRQRVAPADGRHTGFGWRLGLPAVVVLGALVVALAVAGVFNAGGRSGSPARPAVVSPSQAAPAPAAPTAALPSKHRRHHSRTTRSRRRRAASSTARVTPTAVAPAVTPAPTPAVTPVASAPAPAATSAPAKPSHTVTAVGPGPSSSGSPASPAPPSGSSGFTPSP
jgi:hypothetical protein